MKKTTVTIVPGGEKRDFGKGTLLLDALAEMGVMLKTPCGGRGFCGKCGIDVEGHDGVRTPEEERLFPGEPLRRLSCQTRIDAPLRVRLPARTRLYGTGERRLPEGNSFGIAIDIGTTSVQTSLVNEKCVSFPLDSFLNPQRRYGHDVIARISASGEEGRRGEISRIIHGALSASLLRSLDEAAIRPGSIHTVTVSGNTTMLYFFFGEDVRPLGVYPYHAAVLDFSGRSPADTGLAPFTGASLYGLPAASSFLGGDLVGGLATAESLGYGKNCFFIDIGTNGEMFLINGGGDVYATSCAMGPALEGMNISCGMTAEDGAIAHAGSEEGTLSLSVIGGSKPVGVCGTGIIDLVSLLLGEGLLDRSGGLRADRGPGSLFRGGVSAGPSGKYVAVAEGVSLRQSDIRNIQLAKGASLAASHILLEDAGCDAGQVRHVLISGAFGANLDLEHFRRLAFIPDFPGAEYHFLGNTSLRAAELFCCNASFRERAGALRDSIRIVELSTHSRFNDEFMRCLDF
jgi:uncharacterized 2Fe-2S/4Fe-4S cluster protein (DUF4445 family)